MHPRTGTHARELRLRRGWAASTATVPRAAATWDGLDFTELAADDAEIREWILDGRPARLQRNPIARFFMDRQALRMPAFRGHIETKDVEAIVAYIRWLRRSRLGAAAGAMK
jgi:hypothetical protein